MALKETLLTKSLTSHALDEDELIQLVNQSVTNLDDSASLPTAGVEYLGQSYFIKGIHYVCELVESVPTWVTYDTSGQSLHYPDASGKPTLDGITINGALTKAALGIAADSTTRTEKTDIVSTDKILLNDDGYTNVDAISQYLAINYDNYPNYTEQYRNLYIDNGNLSKTTTATSTNIVLSNITGTNYHDFTFTFDQAGKIRLDDDFSSLLNISGFNGTSNYTILQQLYVNDVLVLQDTFSEVFASTSINVSRYIANVYSGYTDFIYNIGDILKLKITITNNTTPQNETITITGNSIFTSKYEDGSYILDERTHTTGTGNYDAIYNNRKKTLFTIKQTYAGNVNLSINNNGSNGRLEYCNQEHEVLWRNNSGAQRVITFSGTNIYAPAATITIPDTKAASFKFKLISIANVPKIFISCINIYL